MKEFFFNITWIIPVFPFLAFLIIILFTQGNKKLSHSLSIGSMVLAWLVGWGVAFSAIGTPHLGEHPIHKSIPWFETGTTFFEIGYWIDPLMAIALFMVPFVCLMIFIYAVGYMGYGTDEVDPNYSRFFAYIALFATGMLGLVISENLLTLFMSWEIMGLCSYLLIGFWFEKNYDDPNKITPRQAGLKAFLVTKIGDLFLVLGILYLYSQAGTLSYADTLFNHEFLVQLAETPALPIFGGWSAASAIALLIFGGSVGKSAQFPLHVWLPDAMEGPTPVSALIHAATMVSAGVFLVARIFPLLNIVVELEIHNPTMGVIAFIGAFTALFASIIALAQNDIKGVLAFSTISQLGYMIAALGIGAYVAATFHLITHAFFKALLFMGSGSVIIGCHHEQDMMELGGLRKKMPKTFWTFLAGGLALSGFPLITAGFWSKDEILAHAWEEFIHYGTASWPFFVWLLLTIAAFLTAFYTARQISLTFLGKPRSHHSEHAHETPNTMTFPLIILAFFAITLGWVGIPEEIVGHGNNWFHAFVGHEYASTPLSLPVMLLSSGLAIGGLGLGWLVYGRKPLEAGQMDPLQKGMEKIRLGWLYKAMQKRFYFDEIYEVIFINGSIKLADIFYNFDYNWVINPIVNGVGTVTRGISNIFNKFDEKVVDGLVNLTGLSGVKLADLGGITDLKVVDGFVNGIADVTGWIGERIFRPIQTGKVQNYLLILLISMLAIIGIYLAIMAKSNYEENMMNFPVLSAITFVPLLISVIVLIIPKSKENLIRWVATILSLIPLVLAIYVYYVVQADPGTMQFKEEYSWIPAIDAFYRMGVDGLSAMMLVLTALLSTLCLYYSIYTIKDRVKEYYFLFLLLQVGMTGVFVSLDFVFFYVFWEIGLVPMYLLIGVWGGKRRIYASIKFFLYTLAGSMAMLLAIIAVYLNTGTFNILEAATAQPFAGNFTVAAVAFWAFFIGFAIKVPIFPFHTWLPDAHTEAPTTGSVILAGVLLKLGAYGLIRIVLPMFPEQFGYFSYDVPIIPILAVISIVYGALVCMAQWDLKRLIAYSSVSHMGYVTLGVSAAAASIRAGGDATSAIIALNGASLQLFTHGIITGGLFFLVGMIYDRAHTRQIKDFGGLGAKMPYYYGIMMVTGFASLGLPGLAGFWSELFVFRGTFAIIPVFAMIGILGLVFTAAYILWKVIQHVFLGEFDQEKWDAATHNAPITDLATFEKVTMWPLVIIMVLIGLYPSLIVRLLNAVSTVMISNF